jgi:hypothetical protein
MADSDNYIAPVCRARGGEVLLVLSTFSAFWRRWTGMMLQKNAITIIDAQGAWFERAVSFSGRPRERLVALTEAERLCIRLFPFHHRSLPVIRLASQPGRAGEDYRNALRRCEQRLLLLIERLVGDAIILGDLTRRGMPDPEGLARSIWAVAFRARTLVNLAIPEPGGDGEQELRLSTDAADVLLDALGWRPLSSEWDYRATRRRIREVLFAHEYRSMPSAAR